MIIGKEMIRYVQSKLGFVTDSSQSIQNQSALQTARAPIPPVAFYPPQLSIKWRLPLLIGTLLLSVVFVMTWAAYREVKSTALEAGHERLRYVTQQLVSLLQQSTSNTVTKTIAVANESLIRSYLHFPEARADAEVAAVLRQFLPPQDPNGVRVEIRGANHSLVMALPEGAPSMPADLETEFKQTDASPSFGIGGAIRLAEGKIVYPLIAAVKNDLGRSTGYLVRWRRIGTTPETRQRLVNLIGSQADLYIGNDQGDVWSDFVNLVPKPPVEVRFASDVTSYEREGKEKRNYPVSALGRPVIGTPWYILVEFSHQELLAQAGRFLRRMIMMGMILLGIGLAFALIVSRKITQPLRSLTQAASAIAGGEYSRVVEARTRDELGALASAFNTMAVQVRDSQHKLEQMVQERTAELEVANRELESFSYSVSHDLRSPLRAMAGFSRILREEYEPQLPTEAQRYLRLVQDNAQQMGQLIDDLLTFSRLGRQSLKRQPVDPGGLARVTLEELLDPKHRPRVQVIIGDLPMCQADPALLKQVFVNLFANAIKYTRQREVAVIEIGCHRGGENEAPVYFVKDNGVGFDMQYVHKLFGVFQRLHRAEEYEGTGVGLATVQRIIHRHGGRIWADATVGQGATFYFTLGREKND